MRGDASARNSDTPGELNREIRESLPSSIRKVTYFTIPGNGNVRFVSTYRLILAPSPSVTPIFAILKASFPCARTFHTRQTDSNGLAQQTDYASGKEGSA